MIPSFAFSSAIDNQFLSKAERKVETMYQDLKILSDKNSSKAREIRRTFVDKYFKESDQNSPNEFKYLGYNNPDVQAFKTDIAARGYVNYFYDMFRNQKYANCSFSFQRRYSNIIHGPEFKKNEAPPKLAQVIVRKVYSRNGKPFQVFEDTLIVGLEQMKVHKWANKISRHHIGDFESNQILDVEQMKDNADLAYDKKNYHKAYQIYQSIVNKYPNEGDPYYRMAIMLYKKNYGEYLNKKERQKLILDYLDKAINLGTSTTKACADNMKYWITC